MSFFLFFQPTFTQGLIVGQISILLLLGAILKYLFFEPGLSENASPGNGDDKQQENDTFLRQRTRTRLRKAAIKKEESLQQLLEEVVDGVESTEWFNVLLKQVRSSSHYRTNRRYCFAAAGC